MINKSIKTCTTRNMLIVSVIKPVLQQPQHRELIRPASDSAPPDLTTHCTPKVSTDY